MTSMPPSDSRGPVGGLFGYPVEPISPETMGDSSLTLGPPWWLPLVPDHAALFCNARSAIRAIAHRIAPRRIWLPTLICPSVPRALADAPGELIRYPMGGYGRFDDAALQGQVGPGDLVLVVDAFGFPVPEATCRGLVEAGARLLVDASQALWAPIDRTAHWFVFSPRKFVGVPDGGIVIAPDPDDFPPSPEQRPPSEWVWAEHLACAGRTVHDAGGSSLSWFERYKEAKALMPTGDVRMSDLALAILRHGIDWAHEAEARRRNFRVLLEHLAQVAVFDSLPEGVVPLAFPIRTSRRDDVLAALHARRIFAPVHWPGLPEAEQYLSLVIDPRVTPAELDATVDCVQPH